jgi:uncharacterized membrane protein
VGQSELLTGSSRLTVPPISLETTRPANGKKKRSWVGRIVITLLGVVVVVVLPFVLLIRVAVYLYAVRGVPTWMAFGGGALATVLVLTLYAAWVSKKLTGATRVRVLMTRVALPLVLAYCAYGLLYLSSVNAKGEAVRSYYTSLHPMLRIAVSTVILVDRDIVLTDLRREPDDYTAMGLPARRESMHYKQSDGFVHALDLRTVGRSWWRNWVVEGYFRAMGFETLRHVGTEDHLHVALPPH